MVKAISHTSTRKRLQPMEDEMDPPSWFGVACEGFHVTRISYYANSHSTFQQMRLYTSGVVDAYGPLYHLAMTQHWIAGLTRP